MPTRIYFPSGERTTHHNLDEDNQPTLLSVLRELVPDSSLHGLGDTKAWNWSMFWTGPILAATTTAGQLYHLNGIVVTHY